MNEFVLTQENNRNTSITRDQFSPSEAKDVIKNLIDSQLNFYKLKQLQNWIGDHSAAQEELEEKLALLEKRKEEFESIIEQARQLNCSLTVDTSIEIKLNK